MLALLPLSVLRTRKTPGEKRKFVHCVVYLAAAVSSLPHTSRFSPGIFPPGVSAGRFESTLVILQTLQVDVLIVNVVLRNREDTLDRRRNIIRSL